MRETASPLRLKAAWAVAVGVDALQFFLLPTTIEGGFSPLEDGLDLVAMALLWALVGWHWAFLPSLVVKLLPVADLAPTWTLAMAIAHRGLRQASPREGSAEFQGPPKDVTPEEEATTITLEAQSSPAPKPPKA